MGALPYCLLSTALALPGGVEYAVCVDPGRDEQFLPAARALAELHGARLLRFDPADLDGAFASLRGLQPRFVAFVLPPDKIDVDLAHAILERAARLDDDPFVDFEYAFVTGRDGAAAARFVERIARAHRREYGRRTLLFGSWEGEELPATDNLSSLEALRLEGEMRLVAIRGDDNARRDAARAALSACRDKDALLFFSHGYPDEMTACFRAADLREWKIDLTPAILVNCACYNGAPGRWYAPGPQGAAVDRGLVEPGDSVALAVLDAGVAGYVAGIDPWHGPLAIQMFQHLVDDGMRLGEAQNAMLDRLALAFLPDRIAFPPTLSTAQRFGGEGKINRRHNGAGMIVYGDPALAPFAKNASRLAFAELEKSEGGRMALRVGYRPLLDGAPGEDYMLPMQRLFDYYSVASADAVRELSLEVYRRVPLPERVARAPALAVVAARCGRRTIPTGPLQIEIEQTPGASFLHVRVPLAVRAVGSHWPLSIAKNGVAIELAGEGR
jgi:hypothetical protein